MSVPAVNSSLDVANWFFKKSESEGFYLENEKLQHLIFLAQVHYALTNGLKYLMPCLFICDKSGFVEPGLSKTLSFGRPLMENAVFSLEINNFLNLIWQKYATMSIRDLSEFIKCSETYIQNYQSGKKNIVELKNMTELFKSNLSNGAINHTIKTNNKKILISQNGPVVVSKWQPRKINHSNSKENKHA